MAANGMTMTEVRQRLANATNSSQTFHNRAAYYAKSAQRHANRMKKVENNARTQKAANNAARLRYIQELSPNQRNRFLNPTEPPLYVADNYPSNNNSSTETQSWFNYLTCRGSRCRKPKKTGGRRTRRAKSRRVRRTRRS